MSSTSAASRRGRERPRSRRPKRSCGAFLPVLERARGRVTLSIDTCKAAVAAAALAAGAEIVNDVSAGALDPEILRVAAGADAALIVGHLRGTPADMNARARYADVVAEVKAELGARILAARAAGVAQERIWIDPGLGFAKRAEQSVQLLAHLDALARAGLPDRRRRVAQVVPRQVDRSIGRRPRAGDGGGRHRGDPARRQRRTRA